MTRPRLSPAQLTALSLLGALIAVGIFVLPVRGHLNPARIAALVAVLLPSLGLPVWAIRRLKNGIQNEDWTEAQLAPLRRVALAPWVMWLAFACLAVFFVCIISDHDRRQIGWSAYLLSMDLIQLRQALRKPVTKASSAPRIDWRTRPPLHSDHWGQR
jgi:hypothetical protein